MHFSVNVALLGNWYDGGRFEADKKCALPKSRIVDVCKKRSRLVGAVLQSRCRYITFSACIFCGTIYSFSCPGL